MSVAQFAAQVAAAEAVHATAERQQAEVQAEAERRQARLDGLKGELSSIADRRREGDKEEADAGRVTLLKLDIEGLEPLARNAQADAERAAKAVQEAQSRLTETRKELDRAAAEEQAAVLEARLQQIEETFARGIAELARLKKRANPRLLVVPSHVYVLSAAMRQYYQGVVPQ